MPPAGGIGIGIDRLTMLLAGAESIRDLTFLSPLKTEKNLFDLDCFSYVEKPVMKKSIEARALTQSELELSPTDLTVRDLLARANRQAVNEPTTQTPEFYTGLSLQLYREERYVESIAASRAALALRPNYAEA
jgi:tRNA synthetases class II (D, K and N)